MKNSSTYSKIIMGVLCVLALVAVVRSGDQKDNNQSFVLGAILPLSGLAERSGAAQMAGLEMAEGELKALPAGSVPEFEVMVRDSALNPEQGREAAQELLGDGADVLYSSFTQVTREVSPLAAAKKIPLLYDSCNCGFAGENDYAFQIYVDPRKECKAAAEKMKEGGGAKAAFIGPDVPYAAYCYEAMQGVLGKENVIIELKNPDIRKNYSALLSSWATSGIGMIASIPIASDIAEILAANASSGANIPFACFAQQCLTTNIIVSSSAEALANVIAFDFKLNDKFVSTLFAEHPDFSREHITAAAIAHDALVYALSAFPQCSPSDTACFVGASRTPVIPTAIVSQGFGPDRILDYDTRYVEYRGGEFVEAGL